MLVLAYGIQPASAASGSYAPIIFSLGGMAYGYWLLAYWASVLQELQPLWSYDPSDLPSTNQYDLAHISPPSMP